MKVLENSFPFYQHLKIEVRFGRFWISTQISTAFPQLPAMFKKILDKYEYHELYKYS
jgi:hypothetical protein